MWPGERNSSAAATAYDVAYGAGLIEPAQMVFEVELEREHTEARLAFDVRWMRFANNNGLPFEGVKFPAQPSALELAYKPATGIGRATAERADW